MRKTSFQIPRMPKPAGHLGVFAAAIMSTVPLWSGNGFAQSPAALYPSGSQRSNQSNDGSSSREAREAAIQRIPFQQLTPEATSRLRSVTENASYFRRMPSEVVDCDQEMFAFLVRHPEVIVNIWDVMGVTKVSLKRTGPFQLRGNDGAGTSSNMDLVFGNDSMHIYFANGSYQGNLWPRELTGRCVVVLHNRPSPLVGNKQGMTTSMDIFMKLENVGADLVVKTLGPLVGKTADYNFSECASFFSQISRTAEQNPYGMLQLAKRLNNIDPKVRDQFVSTTQSVAKRGGALTTNLSNNPALVAKQASEEPIPEFTLGPRVPPPDSLSTRRVLESRNETEEERVDSPTILLIGKEEKNKN
ncbi:MAG: hypothetical protein ABL921_24930 [Pirellula sp.]